MILILSSPSDFSTDKVIDWIEKLGGRYLRVQPTQFLNPIGGVKIPFDNSQLLITTDNQQIDITEINIVWHRKWHYLQGIGFSDLFENSKTNEGISDVLKIEYKTFSDYLFNLFEHAQWLDHPTSARKSKISQLSFAQNAGMCIPETMITSYKKDLQKFKNKHITIITKPIERNIFFIDDKNNFQAYTSSLSQQDIDDLPETFFASLFQEQIEKKIEIRVFYLEGEIYSMAIFSQNDKQTSVDFRKYNHTKPNRNVPIQLPIELEEKIRVFMKKMGLHSGSLDFIKSVSGDYVFLEVNPAGQYGMTSYPCNYNLDKKIAEYLIKNDYAKSERKQTVSN